MAKVLPVVKEGAIIGYYFDCPACGHAHVFYNHLANFAVKWNFNGDVNRPTFHPSMLATHDGGKGRCHSIVADGKIKYLDDCQHEFKGKTIELPDMET